MPEELERLARRRGDVMYLRVILVMERYRNFEDEHVPQQLGIALIPMATLIKQVDGGDSHHAVNVVDSP